ncbi:hypothetical protein OEA41_008335 [Lepraria neglecta]|uniref:Heterokaryon incompatibility domain-containing protein n=1 Tax=Lepraria neglecta TaxID=209136 RepID=A0AAD9ZHY7_9LECA|nr:hypothetical protein OEA41_008335 [Lepraria neglecta]
MSHMKTADTHWIDVDDSKSAECTYKTLSKPSEIRLVKLHPLKIEDGPREDRADTLGPLYVELIHTDLEEATDFTGISYIWCSSNRQHTVLTATNKVLYVTENVRNILKILRPEALDEPSYLWIDQLCINQED